LPADGQATSEIPAGASFLRHVGRTAEAMEQVGSMPAAYALAFSPIENVEHAGTFTGQTNSGTGPSARGAG